MSELEAWILTIGNEIINAVITDTNRETISRELRSCGVSVKGMLSVGDNPEQIGKALDHAMSSAPITVVSGGLGPTEDDKTAAAVAEYLGCELVLNKEQLGNIEARFKKWNRPMAPTNVKQAMLPCGSIALTNSWGTAPGFCIQKNGSIALFFPGVPRELLNMLKNVGLPLIFKHFKRPSKIFASKTIIVYGLSESKLGEMLNDIARDSSDYHLAFLPRFPVIRLRIDISAETEEEAARKMAEKQALVVDRISENVISHSGQSMEEVVLDILQQRKLTLGCAESITGGMIGEMLTRVAGSSDNFMGSIVSYSNDMKMNILGVEESTLKEKGAVSQLCAREMAIGAKRACNSDIGLSITGIAGPGGGSEHKPVGTFFVGLATPDGVLSRGYLLPGTREWIRTLAAMQSLDLLRRYYLGYKLHGTEDDSLC